MKTRKKIMIALLFVCIAALGYSGFVLISDYLESKSNIETYEDIIHDAIKPTPEKTPSPSPTPRHTSSVPTPEPTPKPVFEYWPELDYTVLRLKNIDFTAWLTSSDTVINYPVVHGSDNEYYLSHLFNGYGGESGTLFIDYRNIGDFTDRNTIIYGHNMNNDTMFGTLTEYRKQEYYEEHPKMQLMTMDGNYILELFAGYVAKPNYSKAWEREFSSDEDFLNWIDSQIKLSTFTADGVEITKDDRIVSLSTCAYDFADARYVLFCKLVPTDEGVYP